MEIPSNTLLIFPVAGKCWSDYRSDPRIVDPVSGRPSYGGWRYKRSADHVHRGIDLYAPSGTPVLAVSNGYVEARSARTPDGEFSFAGNRLILRCEDGFLVKYFHLGTSNHHAEDAFIFTEEFRDHPVLAGQKIGWVGFSGGDKAKRTLLTASEAHLHFEYYANGDHEIDCDPSRLLAKTETRFA